MKGDDEQQGQCVRVSNGKREAIIWIDPKTMSYKVIHCNWFNECIKCNVLINGHCPGYCDLISGAKQYLRGRKRRNIQVNVISNKECAIISNYNPKELTKIDYEEPEFDEFEDFEGNGAFTNPSFKYI